MSFFMCFIPSGWVALYPAAGYNSTHSLGTKQITNKRKDYSNAPNLYPQSRGKPNTSTTLLLNLR